MCTQPYHYFGALATTLLAMGLALNTAGCGDAAVPLGLDGTPSPTVAASHGSEVSPQPEPPSLLRLPYSMTALGRGEFRGELGSCRLQASLTIVGAIGVITHVRWRFEAVDPATGATLGGELSGIVDSTTGITTSSGVFSSSLPAVQFRALEHGRFTAGEDGAPHEFAGLIALNPQPEPPSDPSVPPNPCVVESARTAGVW